MAEKFTRQDQLVQMVNGLIAEPVDRCFEWPFGRHSKNGYGAVYVKGSGRANPRFVVAHRLSHEIANGPIPDGWQVAHLCNNKPCINPRHLKAMTPESHYELDKPIRQRSCSPIGQKTGPVNGRSRRGKLQNGNTRGFPNVVFIRARSRFEGRFRHDGRVYRVPGLHRTAEDAYLAVQRFRKERGLNA